MRTSADLARDRFVHARVTRLATVFADGVAHLVPITFAVAGDAAEPVGVELLAARYPAYAEQPPRGPPVLVTVARWSGWQAARGSAWSG